MVSEVSLLVKYLENLGEFASYFGLHLIKRTAVALTLDRAITSVTQRCMILTVSAKTSESFSCDNTQGFSATNSEI